MASLPAMRVWAPAGPREVRFAMEAVLAGDQPAYLRMPRRPLEDLAGEPAPWRWLGEPGPVALAGTGLGTHLALWASERLAGLGQRVAVLHCPQVSPLPDGLDEALAGVEHLFVVEDHVRHGGLASLLQGLGLPLPITALGWPAGWPGQSGDDLDLLRQNGLAPEQIAATVLASLREGRA